MPVHCQTRKMVHVKHEQTGISLEAAVDELQKDFESAMEAVLGAIRQKHGVTEQQMSQASATACQCRSSLPPEGSPVALVAHCRVAVP